MDLKIHPFDPKVMEARRVDPNRGPPTILIVGSRGTGKSYLVKQLMYFFQKIPTGIIATGSEASAESFGEFFPRSFIYDHVNVKRIEDIAEHQARTRRSNPVGDYSTFILFDDCGYDKSVTRQKVIKRIFCNGRHLKILMMMTVQYCRDVPPDMRSNTDYIFLLREPGMQERRKLWTDYASIIPDFKTFNAVMDRCTDNRGILVIDKTSISNKVEDCVFWYRASADIPKYRVGTKQLWDFHEKHYRPDGVDETPAAPDRPTIKTLTKAEAKKAEKAAAKKARSLKKTKK